MLTIFITLGHELGQREGESLDSITLCLFAYVRVTGMLIKKEQFCMPYFIKLQLNYLKFISAKKR